MAILVYRMRCLLGLGALALAACAPRVEPPLVDPAAAEARRQDVERARAEFLAIAEGLSGGANPYLGEAPMRKTEERLAGGGLTPEQEFLLRYQLAAYKVLHGEPAAGVALVDEALGLLDRARRTAPPNSPVHRILADLLEIRGLSYLTLAEDRNCVAHHTAESCIFPIRGGGVHVAPAAASEALDSFARYLRLRPDDFGVRWLLNVAAMAAGRYPEAVPLQWRVPDERAGSSNAIARFVDVAPQLGVATVNQCGGVIVEDFDGDGLLDIVTSSFDPATPLTYYAGSGGDGFEDRSRGSGLEGQLGGLNLISADYDNDGDPDILVLRGAWLFADGRIRNSLLRNDGGGTFTDVTRAAGLADPAMPTQAAAWGDYDNDGDLDLYVGNESPRDPDLHFPSQLFRNNGDGTFEDVAREAGVTNDRYAKGVTAGDYDNDGDLDIYVSNVGANRLYRNEGGGRFRDVAPELGLTEPAGRSFAPWFFDYDNDGDLDLFVSAYDAQVDDVARDWLGLPFEASIPALYRNNGDGTFRDVAREAGLAHPYLPMGANFGDLDNDGWLDVYLGTGNPGLETLVPNVMLRNDAGRRFDDVTTAGGFGHLQKGHGIAFADLDHDGDQDIYHQLGGFYPGDRFANALFLNPGNRNRHLKLRLTGVTSNRDAVGARIRVVVETPGGERTIHRAVGSVSSFGGSPFARQEIGLGDAVGIREVTVWWPASGLRASYRDLPLDAFVRITEGKPSFDAMPLRRFTFRGI